MSDDELLWGADAIGAAINRSRRQTWHLLSVGALDAWKIGGQWVSTRSRLQGKPAQGEQPGAPHSRVFVSRHEQAGKMSATFRRKANRS
jgi:hypothetical protein